MRPAREAETGGKFPQVPGHLGPRMPEAAGRSLQGRSPAQTLISDPGRESFLCLHCPPEALCCSRPRTPIQPLLAETCQFSPKSLRIQKPAPPQPPLPSAGDRRPWLLWPPGAGGRPCWVEPPGLWLLPLAFTAHGRGMVEPPAPSERTAWRGWPCSLSTWAPHTSDNPGL